MRHLVTIRQIDKIDPIRDADRIEVATVDGWKVVVRKNEFEINEKIVFFEIDSFLPIEDRYEFLRKSSYKMMEDGREGFRLRSVKLRKQISQGLAMPLSVFSELDKDIEIGTDVTDILHVTKYEPPIPVHISGKVKGRFPYFVPKTDEERIQNLTEYFKIYADVEFEMTEKLDGCSVTYYKHDGEFGVCSRNLELRESATNTLWKVARELDLENRLSDNLALQGELVGPRLQSNPYKLMELNFFVFNVYDTEAQRYLGSEQRLHTIESMKIQHVPVLHKCLKPLKWDMERMLKLPERPSQLNEKIEMEGVVLKSLEQVDVGQISFKVINNNLLTSK